MSEPSEAVTRGIRVEVSPSYSREHSAPSRNEWFFLYTVRISNESEEQVQVLNRHWIITDATGEVQEVKGAGVVGEQPILDPGDFFEYTSGCPLATPFGSMAGTYEMETAGGERFEAEIGLFSLREPGAIH